MGDEMTDAKTKKRINTTEYLSKDILEDDFIKVFWYLLKIQMLLGTCRVDARDRFISAPTKWQKLYTILLTITVNAIHLLSIAVYLVLTYPFNESLIGVTVFSACINSITFSCYIIHARFMYNNKNINFYIRMQKIDRLMGIEHNKTINNIFRYANIVSVLINVLIFICMLLMVMSEGVLALLTYSGGMWTILTVLFEITLCSNLTIYFFIRTRLINSILINFIEGRVPLKSKYSGPYKNVLRHVAAQTRDYLTTHLDEYLQSLLECFTIYQDLYRFPVAIYFTILLSYTLSSVQFIIIGLKNHLISSTDLTLPPILLGTTLFLGLVLIIRIELLNKEIKETKQLTVMVMSLYFEGPLRAKAKRMCRMIEESPPIFSVYDMWHVNAVFLVRFFNVVSTLVVTLLQFTVL